MSQADKSLTQRLAEIGIRHEPSTHHNCRRLITEHDVHIDHMNYAQALEFVRTAECAA